MEKYLVNNKTIALVKINKKTLIIDVNKVEVLNKSINKIINDSCNYYGSSLKGRKISAQNILNLKYKVPIVIDDKNNIIIIQLNSPRNRVSLYLVTNKVINYEFNQNKLKILCSHNIIFNVKISKNTFEKLLINSLQLNNVLNWRKNANLL